MDYLLLLASLGITRSPLVQMTDGTGSELPKTKKQGYNFPTQKHEQHLGAVWQLAVRQAPSCVAITDVLCHFPSSYIPFSSPQHDRGPELPWCTRDLQHKPAWGSGGARKICALLFPWDVSQGCCPTHTLWPPAPVSYSGAQAVTVSLPLLGPWPERSDGVAHGEKAMSCLGHSKRVQGLGPSCSSIRLPYWDAKQVSTSLGFQPRVVDWDIGSTGWTRDKRHMQCQRLHSFREGAAILGKERLSTSSRGIWECNCHWQSTEGALTGHI